MNCNTTHYRANSSSVPGDPTPAADLDFLLAHGDAFHLDAAGRHVPLSDDGLPHGVGTYLVGGTAVLGGPERLGAIPNGRVFLDPTGRWLGVERPGPELHLFDAAGLQAGFRFHAAGIGSKTALHPDGDAIACREEDQLHLYGPDGHLLRSATYPPGREWWHEEALAFSPCGDYLWFAHTDPDAGAMLYLLRYPTLDVADTCRPSSDDASPYDTAGWWHELAVTTNPATGHLAVRRQAGDDFLTLHFYRAEDGRIVQLRQRLHGSDGDVNGETVGEAVFAPDGRRFLLLDSDGFLNEFTFPGCRLLGQMTADCVGVDAEYRDVRTHGYAGGFVVVEVEGEMAAVRSGDHRPSLLRWSFVGEVLPNGLLVAVGGTEREVSAFRCTGRPFPVVAAFDSDAVRVVAAYRKRRGKWSVADGIGWVGLTPVVVP